MQVSRLCLAASLLAIASACPALAAEDVGAGQEIYQAQCSACHSNQPGVNGIGPSLAGVAGRKAGSLPGFHFTPAISGSGLTWDAKTFIQFLADPSKLVPGTAMTVMVPDETGRANLYAYLATLKDTTAGTKPSGPAVAKITGPTQDELNGAESATDTWLYASHDYAGSRFVDLKEITPANAKNMRPVCLYRSEQPASVQTSPLVYGGVMYLTFGRATVAIDAKTCRERWTYIWQPKGQEISPANRGAAIKDGKLVRGTADGYLIALDMADGSLLVEPADRERSRRAVSLDAAAHLRRSHHRRAFGRGFRRQELDRSLQARDRRDRSGSSISFPIPVSPAPRHGRIRNR